MKWSVGGGVGFHFVVQLGVSKESKQIFGQANKDGLYYICI